MRPDGYLSLYATEIDQIIARSAEAKIPLQSMATLKVPSDDLNFKALVLLAHVEMGEVLYGWQLVRWKDAWEDAAAGWYDEHGYLTFPIGWALSTDMLAPALSLGQLESVTVCDEPVEGPQKFHYYAFCFFESVNQVATTASAYIGYSDQLVTVPRVSDAKKAAGVSEKATLTSVCYMGYLTRAEMTGEEGELEATAEKVPELPSPIDGEYSERREEFESAMADMNITNFSRHTEGEYVNTILEWHWRGWNICTDRQAKSTEAKTLDLSKSRARFEQICNAPTERHRIYTDQYKDLRAQELWSIWNAAINFAQQARDDNTPDVEQATPKPEAIQKEASNDARKNWKSRVTLFGFDLSVETFVVRNRVFAPNDDNHKILMSLRPIFRPFCKVIWEELPVDAGNV